MGPTDARNRASDESVVSNRIEREDVTVCRSDEGFVEKLVIKDGDDWAVYRREPGIDILEYVEGFRSESAAVAALKDLV